MQAVASKVQELETSVPSEPIDDVPRSLRVDLAVRDIQLFEVLSLEEAGADVLASCCRYRYLAEIYNAQALDLNQVLGPAVQMA